ncbi:hypothetical protein FJY70_03675 [candidate division WOR-3 bacterium]|nr:hypothetical protein [candidate division WOR-3 bacterium]
MPAWGAAWDPLAVNRSTGRIYMAHYSTRSFPGIPVFHDSAVIGIQEMPSGEVQRSNRVATVSRNVLYLPQSTSSSPSCLLDVSGRKVLDLHPGANDLRRLSPGVYFVREQPAVGDERATVIKIAIAR